MKKLILLFIICSVAAQAQITAYSNATADNFGAIGGYAFTKLDFYPNVAKPNPYVLSGPSPQNDFTLVATSPQGLKSVGGRLTSTLTNQPISFQFKGNNLRKMSYSLGYAGGIIQITAYTNLGNFSTIGSGGHVSNNFIGFDVQGQNEYITSIEFSAPTIANYSVTINNFTIGDNVSQNVALNFDGVNDYVGVHYSVGNFNYNQPFTVSCWVRPATSQTYLSNQDNAIIEKWDQTGPYPFVIRYLNQTAGSNEGKVRVARYDGINNPTITSTAKINDGKWHHIAFTSGGNLGTMNLYIDGVQQGSGITDNTAQTTTNSAPIYFGRRGNGAEGVNYFKGDIDEVRIWAFATTQTSIQNEMFCKTPTLALAAFNFGNGSPHNDNRRILSVVNSVNINSLGFLYDFDKIGDASNFVTGQVKYVKKDATGSNDGSSWANAFTDLQSALPAKTCNDLFDVYVATGTHKPHASNTSLSFNIPSGMKIYGGFAGTEKNINERDMALIHTTNKTTLSGDLNNNDTQFVFDATRNGNSSILVIINEATLDGFTMRGGSGGIYKDDLGEVKISNCKIIDNNVGLRLNGNSTVSKCIIAGNNVDGVYMENNSTNFQNCLIANNGRYGIYNDSYGSNSQVNFTNCTIASNANAGIQNESGFELSITNNIKNTIIKDNAGGGIVDGGGGFTTNNISYSLVENQFGNTANPQFVSPLPNTVRSDAGDYRLKWCSLAIGAGNNTGISPLDLDRNPRNFNGTADMGAFEFLGNTPSQLPTSNIIGTIDSPTYAGGVIQTITSTAKILAPAGAIDFKAPNSIILSPGFEARGVGKYFKAEIGANVGCSN
jgi:hypothetical protein